MEKGPVDLILGSIEYGLKLSGSKIGLIIKGRLSVSYCGRVRGIPEGCMMTGIRNSGEQTDTLISKVLWILDGMGMEIDQALNIIS